VVPKDQLSPSYQAFNRAFGWLRGGATLAAMHRGLYWRTSEGLQLDSGAFVAGPEQAAGIEAEVVGKPAAAFFATALLRHCCTDCRAR
jgi:ribonucleotide monophosphatase NagD (HAD superfamily)